MKTDAAGSFAPATPHGVAVAHVDEPCADGGATWLAVPGRAIYGRPGGLPVERSDSVATPPPELPPPPSSLALGLSALAGIGLYHAGRTVRRAHFGAIPDWYHEHAGPVGHSAPLDLQRVFWPVCILDLPVHLAFPLWHRLTADGEPCPPASRIPIAVVPRGPPLDPGS